MKLIAYKTFYSTQEFEQWQLSDSCDCIMDDMTDTRMINSVIPISAGISGGQSDQSTDRGYGTVETTANISLVPSYSIFVTYFKESE